MGFRSTFTTGDYFLKWPQWFCEKYSGKIWFNEDFTGSLQSVRENKTYGLWQTLHKDIQLAIDWNIFKSRFVIVYLHECGGITRCQIEKDVIKWSEPASWTITSGVRHDYCYKCSDV